MCRAVWVLIGFLLLSCGRIGFEPLDELADAQTSDTGSDSAPTDVPGSDTVIDVVSPTDVVADAQLDVGADTGDTDSSDVAPDAPRDAMVGGRVCGDTGPLRERLMVHYPCESVTAGSTPDLGPLGLDATCEGPECPNTGPGQVGNGCLFIAASSDHLVVNPPTATFFGPDVGFTVAAFVQVNGTPGTNTILAVMADDEQENTLALFATGDSFPTGLELAVGGLGAITSYGRASALEQFRYHHVAASYVPVAAGGDGRVRVFVDGVLLGTSGSPFDGFGADGGALYIGTNYIGGTLDRPWEGFIDELYLFTGGLIESEVAALAGCGEER